MRIVLLLVALLVPVTLGSGCARDITVREGMDASTRTIRAEHKQWSQMAHDGTPLPRLSDFDLRNRMAAHKAYEDLVAADRARDKK